MTASLNRREITTAEWEKANNEAKHLRCVIEELQDEMMKAAQEYLLKIAQRDKRITELTDEVGMLKYRLENP